MRKRLPIGFATSTLLFVALVFLGSGALLSLQKVHKPLPINGELEPTHEEKVILSSGEGIRRLASSYGSIDLQIDSKEPVLSYRTRPVDGAPIFTAMVYADGHGVAVFPPGYASAGTYEFLVSEGTLKDLLGNALNAGLLDLQSNDLAETNTSPDSGGHVLSYHFAEYRNRSHSFSPYGRTFFLPSLSSSSLIKDKRLPLFQVLTLTIQELSKMADEARDKGKGNGQR